MIIERIQWPEGYELYAKSLADLGPHLATAKFDKPPQLDLSFTINDHTFFLGFLTTALFLQLQAADPKHADVNNYLNGNPCSTANGQTS